MFKIISQEAYDKLPWYKKIFYRVEKHFATVDDAYKARPKKWIYNLVFFGILIGVLLWFSLDIGFFEHFRTPNWTKFGKMLEGFISPDWSYFFGYGSFSFEKSVIYEVLQTFAIAFIGTSFSAILSIPFGFFASRRMVGKWAIISEMLLILIRTFPEILMGFIFIKVFGFGSFTGVMVLSIHSIGMIGKMYAEQLDVIEEGPLEALNACGASTMARIKLGVVPQVAPNFLNVILYRFDLNIRTASLLGLVGAGGVGYSISVHSQNSHWPQLAAVLYGVIILVILVDIVSSKLRKKLI